MSGSKQWGENLPFLAGEFRGVWLWTTVWSYTQSRGMESRGPHGSLFAFYGLGVLQLSLTWDSICNWANVTSLLMPGSHSLAPAKLFFFRISNFLWIFSSVFVVCRCWGQTRARPSLRLIVIPLSQCALSLPVFLRVHTFPSLVFLLYYKTFYWIIWGRGYL